jgi:predicted AAA+ superfamily ATPase
MTMSERQVETPTVSLAALLGGERPRVDGHTTLRLGDYVEEILRSGFPGLRDLPPRLLEAQLDSYLDHIVDREFEELGRSVRRPATLRRWMTAYAAATATTASFEKIRDAATGDQADKPSRPTSIAYRDILERLWILDPVPAWLPTLNRMSRLSSPPKHHLADPALAARLLGVDAAGLLQGGASGPDLPRDGTLLGSLFESLVTLCVRVYAQQARARVSHLRTQRGEREVDLIVERGRSVLAIEVKLGQVAEDHDVRHLRWLREELGDGLADAVIVTTGQTAYRRPDGIAVIPAALLGP